MKQRVFAGVALLVGLIAAMTLSVSALSAPVPGALPTGSPPASTERIAMPGDRNAPPIGGPSTLLVFHRSGNPWGVSVDERAVYTLNLLGHFGPVTVKAAEDVKAADVAQADAIVYVRIDAAQKVPEALSDAVAAGTKPFLWAGPGFDQVFEDHKDLRSKLGFEVGTEWIVDADQISYSGGSLPRDTNSHGFERVQITGPAATSLAEAFHGVRSRGPFALRSDNLIHVVEVPVGYVTEDSHWLAFADLLFELLDPERPSRSRAMIRLEDVGPYADPDILIELADGLYERGIPFSIAVYSVWVDRNEKYDLGTEIRLADRPEVVEALKYMQERGGTILFHGLTHQHGKRKNPYSGTSGEDFEFFTADIDDADNVIATGPLEADSPEWVLNRVRQGLAELEEVGLGRPTVFEFPHYQGSRTSYQTIAPHFDARYERGAYFHGELTGNVDENNPWDQIFPYPVRDVYGEYVLPENMGNIIPVGFNNNDDRSVDDILASAALTQSVIRDSFASMFYHPYLGSETLFELVDGIEELGFEFVSPQQVLEDWK